MTILPALIFAAFLIGVSKGGIASLGTLAVPFLALFMNPVQAAALMVPILIITDAVAVWLYRHDYSGRNVAILVPATLLGILLATLAMPYVSEPMLLAFTGCVGLWVVARRWLGRMPEMRPATLPAGVFWGTIAGVTTFITHSGAPPMQAFLLPQRLPRLIFAGTIAITFAITNLAKIPSYASLGLFEGIDWSLLILLAAVGITGTIAGRWLTHRLTDHTYVRVIEMLLFMLSLTLLAKAASAWV